LNFIATPYDFVLLDIRMPRLSGSDALKIIKKMPKFENTPVIACTAYLVSGDREKFLAAGFSDFIPKPVLRDKLISSLQKFFS
jgi:CheY-like chemotaxis protein